MANVTLPRYDTTGHSRQFVPGITINTDASFHPLYRTGGYAFYIVSNLFKIRHGGTLKTPIANPIEAEVRSIGYALATLLKQKELPRAGFLVLNTDCVEAMRWLETPKGPVPTYVRKLWDELYYRVGANKRTMRHVKAHSQVEDARSRVNEWCDGEAKKWMREASDVEKQFRRAQRKGMKVKK